MHIIAILVGLVVAIGAIIWRVRAGAQAAHEIADTVEDAGAFVRRQRWRGRSAPRPLDKVDEPMLAATAILVLAIRCDRDVTSEDRARVAGDVSRTFGIDAAEGRDLVAEAEFTVRDVVDESTAAARLARVLTKQCSVFERAQVAGMVRAQAGEDGPSEMRSHLLLRYTEAAGLATSRAE